MWLIAEGKHDHPGWNKDHLSAFVSQTGTANLPMPRDQREEVARRWCSF